MRTARKWMAALIALVMLLGAMPGAFAMNFWCPDEGLSHKWSAWESDNESCGTIWMWRTCERCGAGEQKQTQRDHDWGAWRWCEGDEGTCTYEGSQYRTCKRCGEGQDRSKYGDHKFGYWRIKEEATCTGKGEQRRICELCGYVEERYVDELGHDYGEWVLVKKPTHEEPGLMESVCSRCGDTLQKEVGIDDLPDNMKESMNFTTAIDVEIISDMLLLSGSLGDEIPVELKVTNIGETVVTLNSYMMHFENGDYAENDNRSSWSSEDANINDSYFMPGAEMYSTYTVKVTEADIERGEIIRYFTQYAREFYYPNGEVVRPGYEYTESEEAQLYVINDSPSSDTVEIVIALKEESSEIIVEKLVESEPANGEYYVEGEVINYVVRLDVPKGVTLEEVVVYDQMRFASEPTILAELDTASDEEEALYEYTFNYTVTAEDAGNGYVYNTAYIYCYDPSGDAYVHIFSDEVVVPAAPGEVTDQTGIATLDKAVVSEPANDEYYVLGETIEYEIIFRNMVGHDLHDVEITDPLKGGNEDSVVTIEPVVEPMGVLTLSFSHVVTEEDVERGYVENTATAMWFNPEIEENWTIDSNTVVVPTEPGDFGMSSQMTVDKKITSEPANGVCFVPGEVISFTVSVTNDSEDSLYQMDVIDLLDGSLIGEFDEVLPGETVYAVFEYTVSDFDAITGGVENSAYVYADDPAGEEILEFSNSVYANCGFAEYPFGILSGLEITKEEESLPLNGDYYVLGEEITYLITYFNAGEIPLGEVIVYDSLAGLTDIASAESLDVGESRVCRYKHVVTEADVERGYVANTAYAEYMVNGYMNYAVSEPVYSDTDGIDNEPVYSWPIFGVIDFDTLKQGEDFCEHKLTERTASSETAEIGFCAEHADNHEMLRTMLGFANDSALLAQTYEYAALLWKEEVNKLYAELLKACDAEAHATVIYEFAVFSAYASNHEVFMNSLYSANPEIAKKAVSDLWRNKLIDMCLEINTAPDGRNDSLLSRAQKAGAAEAACGVFEKSADEKGVVETMAFCPQHSFLYGMTDKLVKNGSAADWNNVRQLWNVELTKAVNSAVKNAGDEAGAKIILDNGMFAAWLEARAALLTVLYPENPEIVSEVVVSMIMEHVNGLCAINK